MLGAIELAYVLWGEDWEDDDDMMSRHHHDFDALYVCRVCHLPAIVVYALELKEAGHPIDVDAARMFPPARKNP